MYLAMFFFSVLKQAHLQQKDREKAFSSSILALFNKLFASIMKPGHIGQFIFRNAGFENGFVCNLH